MDLITLKEFATEGQAVILDAVIEHGSHRKAAPHLGLSRQSVDNAMKRLRMSAAARGWSPDHDYTRIVPEGFKVRGVSTYYDEDGKPRAQWVKSSLDEERMAQMRQDALDAFVESVPKIAAPNGPLTYDTDIIP